MCEVFFTNVRETMDETLRNESAEAWKVIVDYPFGALATLRRTM